MSIKLSLNDEIHKLPKAPESLQVLFNMAMKSFGSSLNKPFRFEYIDSEADRVTIANDEDYKSMLKAELGGSKKNVKIFIVIDEESDLSQSFSTEIINNSGSDSIPVKKNLLDDIPICQSTVIQRPSESEMIKKQQEQQQQKPSQLSEAAQKFKSEYKDVLKEVMVEVFRENLPTFVEEVKEALHKDRKEHHHHPKKHGEHSPPPHHHHHHHHRDGPPPHHHHHKRSPSPSGSHRHPHHKDHHHHHHHGPGHKRDPVNHPIARMLAGQYEELPEQNKKKLNELLNDMPAQFFKKVLERMGDDSSGDEEAKKGEEKPKIQPPKNESKLDFELTKTVSTIPANPSTKDLVIYKTILLKNTGTQEWPQGSVLTNVSGVHGTDADVISANPGKECSIVLILSSPRQPGKHVSTWALFTSKDKNTRQQIGQDVEVSFTIAGDIKPPVEQEKKPEPPKSQYSQKIRDKASKLKEILSDAEDESLCLLVSQNPDANIEELMDLYFQQ